MANEVMAVEIEELLRSSENTEQLLERVAPLLPVDLSLVVLDLEHTDQLKLFSLLPIDLAAETLEYLDQQTQYDILHHLGQEVAVPILQQVSSDVVADLLLAVHRHQAERILAWLPEEYRSRVNNLMTFPEGTAGSLATVDYISVREGWIVEQTLEHIRKVGREAEVVSYIYVVNPRGQLVDVVSLRELILASPATPLSEIVNYNVVSVRAAAGQEEAARILSRYDFVALPVVDDHDRMVGIVTVDDLVDVIQEEATEDILKLGGSQPLAESYLKTSVPVLFRKRVGWLLILFLGEAFTGTVLKRFETTLSEAVALAFFIPLLIGTGGNTGSQIVSTLVRSLAVGEVEFKDIFKVWARELETGIFLGLTIGAATWIRALVMGVGLNLGPVVGLTALFIVVWASMLSAVLPLVLHRLKIDPAVVSGPFITTLVDGTGLFIYLTVARVMLGLG